MRFAGTTVAGAAAYAVADVAAGARTKVEQPAVAATEGSPDVNTYSHQPVLLEEAVAALALRPDGRYLDGTFGRGGHARLVLSRLGPTARLLLMDRDRQAIDEAERAFAADARVAIRHAPFSTMAEWDEVRAGLDGVLLDLGVSSPQIDDPSRGFSFQADGPLDMRMDRSRGEPVASWLMRATDAEIADVLWRFGDERRSRAIARAIVAQRQQQPLERTAQLAALVATVPGTRDGHKHPATRTFQALRIFINDELGEVTRGLDAAMAALKPGGRLAVISFHSLEDRLVKQFIAAHDGRATGGRRLPVAVARPALLRPIARIMPGEAELAANPRARSAVLRVAERQP
ncbi:16S rRNA (cytosine(1402)-N(4))-methyltransferase [Pseudofulvimonas gallinarii]|uniref:Ribosomal RNA small subunit methyltransferase H n=2 Tax=Pseudofulvimonas gallinarii TaxID=634155 RepID=A0A4R3LEY6_9GAMM|nr:16S rRNA (cytosine1402-N4)-methyltransferase [Pseudofulvimonas gallinarii]THD13160.1 16S rRNA (cytosine(1402)-N(4))-methyltransferase [Pseudofulvimonas gallinarii]